MATSEFTQLMRQWQAGDEDALHALAEFVNDELRRLAGHYLQGERAGHTLQTTALVNEVWLRVLERDRQAWQNRAHFIGFAATTMRHLLVDWARKKNAEKHGGGAIQISLGQAVAIEAERLTDLVALREALDRLHGFNATAAQVVEARYFGGFQNQEIADALGITEVAATRYWQFAQAWLKRELAGKESGQ